MTWEIAYKAPFHSVPGCETLILTSEYVSAFDIMPEDLELSVIEEILRRINNLPPKSLLPSGEFKIFADDPSIILLNNIKFISIRGFGYLTGPGGLNLSERDAINIQNSFANYVCDRLNRKIEMHTSYFANIKNLPENFCPISIAGKPIDGWEGSQYKVLAPKYQTWLNYKNGGREEDYIIEYKRTVLDQTTREKTVSDLLRLADGKIPCLICYESPGKFCHRHLVAEWLLQSKKISITEY